MKVRHIQNHEEIKYCVKSYLAFNDNSFLPADLITGVRSLEIAVKQNHFVRVATDDNNEILGFISARIVKHQHIAIPVYQQLYFCTWAKGMAAARIVKLLHNKLIEEAESKNICLCLSSGSHEDDDNTFVKMLEKFGWERRNYLAVWKTSHYSEE